MVLALASCGDVKTVAGGPRIGTLKNQDECPKDDNTHITLEVGDQVEVFTSIAPTDQDMKNLPADSPVSKKLNLTYVRAKSGPHAGEYCWVSTANLR